MGSPISLWVLYPHASAEPTTSWVDPPDASLATPVGGRPTTSRADSPRALGRPTTSWVPPSACGFCTRMRVQNPQPDGWTQQMQPARAVGGGTACWGGPAGCGGG